MAVAAAYREYRRILPFAHDGEVVLVDIHRTRQRHAADIDDVARRGYRDGVCKLHFGCCPVGRRFAVCTGRQRREGRQGRQRERRQQGQYHDRRQQHG